MRGTGAATGTSRDNRPGTVPYRCFLAIGLSCTLSSCVTAKLWDLTDADPVEFSMNKMTEREIQERGLTYRKDDDAGVYYVDKTREQRFVDYCVRFFATPATVAMDAVTLVPVLALLSVDGFAKSGQVVQSGGKTIVHPSSKVRGPDVPVTEAGGKIP